MVSRWPLEISVSRIYGSDCAWGVENVVSLLQDHGSGTTLDFGIMSYPTHLNVLFIPLRAKSYLFITLKAIYVRFVKNLLDLTVVVKD